MREIVARHDNHFLASQAVGVEGLAAQAERPTVPPHEGHQVQETQIVFGQKVLLLPIQLAFVLFHALRESHGSLGKQVFH